MVASVVFDGQTLSSIKQVWTPYEATLIIVDGNLNLRPWKSGQQAEHTQPGFHRGFGLRLGQADNTSKPRDAFGPRMLGHIGTQVGDGDLPGMKKQVRGDNTFCQWDPATKVCHCAEGRRGRKTTPHHCFVGAESCAPY